MLRSDITIDRPAEEVWAVVSDAGRISEWFPSIVTPSANSDERSCELEGGVPLTEGVVTNDSSLRRFQYRITGGGVPVESQLGTVDVLALDSGRSLVVCSTEVTPDELAGALGPAIDDGVKGLKEHCERRG
ncbi:SRPBCC family protein [Modestobacter sp. DSM 44400]|uniref:SRPBCC family protein n=1 Tax=Modestobacter sp. DSM 44400 TaxID=1550230 RepID=UPI0020C933C2|nr:SRPBCC family protein [Modestobacter sp. DSM 44400]